jgi:DUF1009 family protein
VSPEPLGILAGGGEVPLRVARTAQAAGRPVHVVALDGWADQRWEGFPVLRERPGAAGRILGHLRARGVRQIVMTGRAQRPSFLSLRPDATGARLLARVGRAYFAGDDGLLRAVARALAAYEDRPAWRVLQRRAMAARFSWDGAAAEYEELYADALARRRAGPRRAARERTEALA